MEKIELVEVPSDIGAGTNGARLGIEAMRVASLNSGDRFFRDHARRSIPERNDRSWEKADDLKAKHLDSILEVVQETAKGVSDILMKHRFPVVLGGDHAIAMGTIGGLKQALPGKRIGVVWIDAHADLNTPFTTPSGNVHGMPLAAALEMDNRDKAGHASANEGSALWERYKDPIEGGGRIMPEDIRFIGVRDLDPPEQETMDQHGMKNITVERVRKEGGKAVAKEVLADLSRCDAIYVSFDVDSLDPTISQGTGTPSPNGLMAEEALALLTPLMESPLLRALDMVEVNPLLDEQGNKMGETAFHLLSHAVLTIEERVGIVGV